MNKNIIEQLTDGVAKVLDEQGYICLFVRLLSADYKSIEGTCVIADEVGGSYSAHFSLDKQGRVSLT